MKNCKFIISAIIGSYLIFLQGCAVEEKKQDVQSFRIDMHNVVRSALKTFPYDLLDTDDKVILIELPSLKENVDEKYSTYVKQGLISGLSSKVLCLEMSITKDELSISESEWTNTFPLSLKDVNQNLKKELEVTKILVFRPLEIMYPYGKSMPANFQVRIYLRLIDLGDRSSEPTTLKVLWSSIISGESSVPVDNKITSRSKVDIDEYVKVHNSTVNGLKGILPDLNKSNGIFIQRIGDYTANLIDDQHPLSSQKKLIEETLGLQKKSLSSSSTSRSNVRSTTTRAGIKKPTHSSKIDEMFMAVEEGLVTALSSKWQGVITEKTLIPDFRKKNQFRVLPYYSSPFQFFSWPLLSKYTSSDHVLFYRVLHISTGESTKVNLYLRLVDISNRGQVVWSRIVAGESLEKIAVSKSKKKSPVYLTSKTLHDMASNVTSHLPLRPFKPGDRVVVLNGSEKARNLDYEQMKRNEIYCEDGVITGLKKLIAKKDSNVIDKIPGLYVAPSETPYYLLRNFMDAANHEELTNATKLLTYEIVQIKNNQGKPIVGVPDTHTLKEKPNDMSIEFNIIDIEKEALVYSGILSTK